MTIHEHIAYNEAKIERFIDAVERQTRMLSRPTASGWSKSLATADDILSRGQEIKRFEVEIRIAREIRSTLINILAED